MHQWFDTPPGRYVLAWERAEFDRAVADDFGYHALQMGLPELDALQANRMPHKSSRTWSPITRRSPSRKTAWTWWCCRTPWN